MGIMRWLFGHGEHHLDRPNAEPSERIARRLVADLHDTGVRFGEWEIHEDGNGEKYFVTRTQWRIPAEDESVPTFFVKMSDEVVANIPVPITEPVEPWHGQAGGTR